jgi:hypothetical protein
MMFWSLLFQGDALLEAIAIDNPPNQIRISENQNRFDPAVRKVQIALLTWDPGCLPQWGADGEFGSEAAAAVHRFKVEELGIPEADVIDDVGPKTVIRLDWIQARSERPFPGDMLVVTEPTATQGQLDGLMQAIQNSGGRLEMGLGPLAAVVSGNQPVVDAIQDLASAPDTGISAIIVPGDDLSGLALDQETATLAAAWLAMFDPTYVAGLLDTSLDGVSWAGLGSCSVEV